MTYNTLNREANATTKKKKEKKRSTTSSPGSIPETLAQLRNFQLVHSKQLNYCSLRSNNEEQCSCLFTHKQLGIVETVLCYSILDSLGVRGCSISPLLLHLFFFFLYNPAYLKRLWKVSVIILNQIYVFETPEVFIFFQNSTLGWNFTVFI